MSRVMSTFAALAVVLASFLFFGNNAYAHERRMLGPYQVVVGWITEPTYTDQLNFVDFRVTDTRVTPAKPVEGVQLTIPMVGVTSGGAAEFKVPLKARSGLPGMYQAGPFMPTVAGTYVFAFAGKIETTDVNEKFTSGPTTFGDASKIADVQYPVKLPATTDLNTSLNTQVADLKSQFTDMKTSVNTKLDAANSGIDQARMFGLGGLALGVLALGLSVASLTRRRA